MMIGLLVVDIQQDYFPGGKMELVGSPAAAEQARRLIQHFRNIEKPIIYIQHVAIRPGASFFVPGSVGIEIHPVVRPTSGETIIQKHYPNSFRETDLLNTIRQRELTDLIICGMMTHMCIDATVRAASDFGFICTVASDACATRDLTEAGSLIPAEQVHGAFLAALRGTYAAVKNTSEILTHTT